MASTYVTSMVENLCGGEANSPEGLCITASAGERISTKVNSRRRLTKMNEEESWERRREDAQRSREMHKTRQAKNNRLPKDKQTNTNKRTTTKAMINRKRQQGFIIEQQRKEKSDSV